MSSVGSKFYLKQCKEEICDHICKRDLIHTQFQDTFHHHLIATSMNQQHMCLILLKVEQTAFTQASLSSLSDIHECLGGLQMAPSSLDKQTVGCNSPHNWLMILAMDLAALCDMWSINVSHLAVISEEVGFACHFVASCLPPPSHPVGVLVVLATSVKTI